MKIICIIGMSGSGKSTVSQYFKALGFKVIRFGDTTYEYMKSHNLPLNLISEIEVSKKLRQEYGLDAYAKLNKDLIDSITDNVVVIDGVYSYEEYTYLKENYDDVLVICIVSDKKKRIKNLTNRKVRNLTEDEMIMRDNHEILNSNKAPLFALADYYILNGDILEIKDRIDEIMKEVVVDGKKCN